MLLVPPAPSQITSDSSSRRSGRDPHPPSASQLKHWQPVSGFLPSGLLSKLQVAYKAALKCGRVNGPKRDGSLNKNSSLAFVGGMIPRFISHMR